MTASENHMIILIMFAPLCMLLMHMINNTGVSEPTKACAFCLALLFSGFTTFYSLIATWHSFFGPEKEAYLTNLGYVVLIWISLLPLDRAMKTVQSEFSLRIIHALIVIHFALESIHFVRFMVGFVNTGELRPVRTVLDDNGSKQD